MVLEADRLLAVPWFDDFREGQRGRFGLVMLVTFVTIALTVALPQEGWSAIVLSAVQGGMLWLAFVASGASRRMIRLAVVAWVVATAATGAAAAGPTEVGDWVAPMVNVVLIATAAIAILRYLVAQGRITVAAVGGVLTVYLLLGLFFTFIYASVYGVTNEPPLSGQDTVDLSDEVYFSFITLATVGYGDLVPANDIVRGLAITQALSGQLYLVSVVALVVSNLGRETNRRQGPPDADT
jgi:hypothetical protein